MKETEIPDSKEKVEEIHPFQEMKMHRHRHGVVWPVFLIFTGSILLLNNLGVLPWGVWDSIWRLWPVIIVIIGLNMIFGKSGIGNFILGLVFTFIVFLVVSAVVAKYNPSFARFMQTNFPEWSYINNLVPQQQNPQDQLPRMPSKNYYR
jgi:flagellar biosynthesis protein FlhB